MKTLKQIAEWFSLSEEDPTLQLLSDIQETGACHGRLGRYRDGDFSSDADWVYGVGARIQRIEEVLGDDDGSIFALYSDAHSEALPEESFNEKAWAESAKCDNATDGNEGP